MLQKFANQNKPLLRQLARSWSPSNSKESAERGRYFLANANGEIVWAENPQASFPTAVQIISSELGPKEWFVAPIRVNDGRVLGFIGATPSSGDTVRLQLESQASLLGQVLAREQELDSMATELMGAYDQLVAMYHISQALRSHLNLDDVLKSLVAEAIELSKAKDGFVTIEEDGEVYCTASTGLLPQYEELTSPLFRTVRELGQPLICNTSSDFEEVLPNVPPEIRRCLASPIFVENKVVACLVLLNKSTQFTAGDQKLLSALADEAGSIIERDSLQAQLLAQERVRRELEIASEIQMGQLPTTLPSAPGLDMAAHSRPATEVGGDFYDFLSLPAGPLAVVLGDVTSKGVPAALFVTVSHNILHRTIPRFSNPQAVLEQFNTDLYDELTRASMFITLFIAYYHPDQRQFIVVNAGHSPVLYYNAHAGRCHLWEADGPPVGVLPTILSANQITKPKGGDILVIMSDGFNEMTNPAGEMFGIQPLMRLLETHAGQSAAEIQNHFFEAVTAFAQGTPQADDLTICVLKVTAD